MASVTRLHAQRSGANSSGGVVSTSSSTRPIASSTVASTDADNGTENMGGSLNNNGSSSNATAAGVGVKRKLGSNAAKSAVIITAHQVLVEFDKLTELIKQKVIYIINKLSCGLILGVTLYESMNLNLLYIDEFLKNYM